MIEKPMQATFNPMVEPVTVIDTEANRLRILNSPIKDLVIDEVIEYRLNDPVFFGYSDEDKRKYRIDMYTDVRTRRLIATISDNHKHGVIYKPSVQYLTIQHGAYLEEADNAEVIQEITRLYDAIQNSGNPDIKDELDALPAKPLMLKHRGQKRPKVSFTLSQEQSIKKAAEIRGVSDAALLIIRSVYSGVTAPYAPTETIEYARWLIQHYQGLLKRRVLDLQDLLGQTECVIV